MKEVAEETEIAGMFEECNYEGKMQHLLGKKKSGYCRVNIK